MESMVGMDIAWKCVSKCLLPCKNHAKAHPPSNRVVRYNVYCLPTWEGKNEMILGNYWEGTGDTMEDKVLYHACHGGGKKIVGK